MSGALTASQTLPARGGPRLTRPHGRPRTGHSTLPCSTDSLVVSCEQRPCRQCAFDLDAGPPCHFKRVTAALIFSTPMFSSNFIAILLKRLLHYQVGLTFTGEPWSVFTDHSPRTEPS